MKVVFQDSNFLYRHFVKKKGDLWLGMTGGLSTRQVKMNVKPFSAFKSGPIRQVVLERRAFKFGDYCSHLATTIIKINNHQNSQT